MLAKLTIIWEMAKGAIFLYKELKSAYTRYKKSSIEKAIQKRKNKVEKQTDAIKDVLNEGPSEISDKKLKDLYRELNRSYGK